MSGLLAIAFPDRASVLGATVVLGFAVFALDAGPYWSVNVGPLQVNDPPLLDVIIAPLVVAAGVITILQSAAAIAGRGRPMPGVRHVILLRPPIFGFVLGAEVLALIRAGWAPRPLAIAPTVLAASSTLMLVVVALSRSQAGSVLTPLALLAAVWRVVVVWAQVGFPHFWRGPLREPALLPMVGNLVVPIAIPLAALWLTRLRRRDLERVGVTPWAAGDVALAGPVLLGIVVLAFESVRHYRILDMLEAAAEDLERYPALGLPVAVLCAGAILHLARLAEATAPPAAPVRSVLRYNRGA